MTSSTAPVARVVNITAMLSLTDLANGAPAGGGGAAGGTRLCFLDFRFDGVPKLLLASAASLEPARGGAAACPVDVGRWPLDAADTPVVGVCRARADDADVPPLLLGRMVPDRLGSRATADGSIFTRMPFSDGFDRRSVNGPSSAARGTLPESSGPRT